MSLNDYTLQELNDICKVEKITKQVMNALNDYIVENEEKWITIKPHGEESEDYRHLKLQDGETPKEAIERVYKKGNDKSKEKNDYKEQIRTLTKEKYDKKQLYEKLDKEQTKLNNAYRKLQRSIWVLNSNEKTASDEEIINAYEKYSNKSHERRNAVKEYNKITSDLKDKKLEYLLKYEKKDIEKSLKKYNTDKIVKDFEELNKKFDYEKLKSEEEKISQEISNKKDEWRNYINSAETREEQEKRAEEYTNWYKTTDLLQKQKEYWEKMSSFKEDRAKAVCKILQIKKGGDFVLTTSKGGVLTSKVEKTNELLSGIINKDFIPDFSPIAKGFNGNRAFVNGNSIHLNSLDSIFTSIHECMHWLENVNPDVLANSMAFLKYRTQNDTTKTLRELTGNKNYESNEDAKADNFFSPYCGKAYTTATEIMSMGVQRLFEHPDKFYKEDREYFNFVIGNLRGEL